MIGIFELNHVHDLVFFKLPRIVFSNFYTSPITPSTTISLIDSKAFSGFRYLKFVHSSNLTMLLSYDPLNSAAREIRLLQLLPAASPADPIKCTLQIVSLSTKPTYIALSYFWGTSEERFPIYVNETEFPATLNLCAALRRMRSDSVCINQANNIEKSGQIPMMKDIYQDAGVVTVWLGEQYDHSEVVMQLILLTSHLYEQDKSVGHEVRQAMMYALEQQAVLFALGSFL